MPRPGWVARKSPDSFWLTHLQHRVFYRRRGWESRIVYPNPGGHFLPVLPNSDPRNKGSGPQGERWPAGPVMVAKQRIIFSPSGLSSPGGIFNLKIIKEKHFQWREGSHLSSGVHCPVRKRLGQPPHKSEGSAALRQSPRGGDAASEGLRDPGLQRGSWKVSGEGAALHCSPRANQSFPTSSQPISLRLRPYPSPPSRSPPSPQQAPGRWESRVTLQVPPPARAPGECVLTSCCVRAGAESLLQLRGAGVS